MSKNFLILCIDGWLSRHMCLDNLIDTMRVSEVVDTTYLVPLFEEEMPIIEYTSEESVLFYIDLEYALDIHELYIIDEYEARMDDDNSALAYEHQSPIEAHKIQYYLHKNIVHREDQCRKEYIVTKIWWEHVLVLIKYPCQYPKRYEKKYESSYHKKHKNPMTTIYPVECRHSEKLEELKWTQSPYGFRNNIISPIDRTYTITPNNDVRSHGLRKTGSIYHSSYSCSLCSVRVRILWSLCNIKYIPNNHTRE